MAQDINELNNHMSVIECYRVLLTADTDILLNKRRRLFVSCFTCKLLLVFCHSIHMIESKISPKLVFLSFFVQNVAVMGLHSLILRALILSGYKCWPSPVFIYQGKCLVFFSASLIDTVSSHTWLVVTKPVVFICEGQEFQAFAKGRWYYNSFFFHLRKQ